MSNGDYTESRPRINSAIFLVFVITALILPVQTTEAQQVRGDIPELQKIDIKEQLGAQIPLGITLVNDAGQTVQLGGYFNKGKPVILTLNYYSCPMLCNLVLNGLVRGMQSISWTPGKEFEVLTISIDPRESSELAASKKKGYLASYSKQVPDNAWTFFVGNESQIKALADAVGFEYYYDKSSNTYAHPALIMTLTPEGKISRYLYGIDFKKNDLRLALLEASSGKIGDIVDRIILYCYHYDPDAKGYVLFANNVMKIGGALTALAIAVLLAGLGLNERRRRKLQNEPVEPVRNRQGI